jgi:SNF2 family DNA or RNA helicase
MPVLEVVEGSLELLLTKCTEAEKQKARLIQCRTWDRGKRGWEFPIRPDTLRELAATLKVEIPEAARTLAAEIGDRENSVKEAKLAGWEKAVATEPMPLKCIPFNHQILAFNIGMTLPASGQLLEQGTGKTAIAIAIMGARYLRKEVKKVLVIAPKNAVSVWAGNKKMSIPGQIDQFAAFPYDVESFLGNINKRAQKLLAWQPSEVLQIAVWNFEGIREEVGKKAILQWNPDMIIIDEAQRIGNPSAKQSKTAYYIGDRTKYRLALTGTPVRNSPLDFFGIMRFVNPDIFGKSVTAFRARYAHTYPLPNGGMIIKPREDMLGELVEKAHSCSFRASKRDCLDLPPVLHQKITCELEPEARRIYNQMKKQSVMELEAIKGKEPRNVFAANVLARAEKLAQIAGGYTKDPDGKWIQVSKAKINATRETVTELVELGKKVIIFAIHVAELDGIERMLTQEKIDFVHLRGGVKDDERDEAKYRFQNDPKCMVFVGQTHASGLGIDLFASHYVLYYSKNYSYEDFDQSLSRADRNGQTEQVTLIHMVAENTIDERVTQAVQDKGNMARLVVDEWRSWLS